jgi:hypothetical protein
LLSPPVGFGDEVLDWLLLLASDFVEPSLFAPDALPSGFADSVLEDDFDSVDDSLFDSLDPPPPSEPFRCAFLP